MDGPDPNIVDAHTEHCCTQHGCKYAFDEDEEKDCTVLNQKGTQSYPCEQCDEVEGSSHLEPLKRKHLRVLEVLLAEHAHEYASDEENEAINALREALRQ